MGHRNKLVLEIDGSPMVRRVAETALAADLDPVIVVVGRGGVDVRRALNGLPLTFAANAEPESGLSSSLRVGVRALSRGVGHGVACAVVLLGDMPWVEPRHVRALLSAFDPEAGRGICVPVHAGRRGNPVLWSARFFSEVAALEGDAGARTLLERHAAYVHEVRVDGDGVLRDVDTPDALAVAPASD
jgi:molybdenum cofactor cytidylyltransferase